MLIAVDGTGPSEDKVYYAEMANSFVRQICKECPDPAELKSYFRGPSLLGKECLPVAIAAFGIIAKVYEAAKKAGNESSFKLFLTGYSRGGATVIFVARILQLMLPEVKIECMALFDAVDRSSLTDVDVIPGNVNKCYHALRDPKTDSRWYFGNCGLNFEPPSKLEKRVFFSTHAGLGGLPWTGDHPTKKVTNPQFDLSKYAKEHPMMMAKVGYPSQATVEVPTITEAQDRAGSAEVHAWMWNNMKRHGMVY
jgi:hypothetical protein